RRGLARRARRGASAGSAGASAGGSGLGRLLFELAPALEAPRELVLDLLDPAAPRLDRVGRLLVPVGRGKPRREVRLFALERLDLGGQRLEFALFPERELDARLRLRRFGP